MFLKKNQEMYKILKITYSMYVSRGGAIYVERDPSLSIWIFT